MKYCKVCRKFGSACKCKSKRKPIVKTKTAVERIEHVIQMVRNTKERAQDKDQDYYNGYQDGLIRSLIELSEAERLEKRGQDG